MEFATINKKEICIILFLVSILLFSLIYKIAIGNNVKYDECLYISTSMQTFTGNTIIEKYRVTKNIATIQCIITYILIVYLVCV